MGKYDLAREKINGYLDAYIRGLITEDETLAMIEEILTLIG